MLPWPTAVVTVMVEVNVGLPVVVPRTTDGQLVGHVPPLMLVESVIDWVAPAVSMAVTVAVAEPPSVALPLVGLTDRL